MAARRFSSARQQLEQGGLARGGEPYEAGAKHSGSDGTTQADFRLYVLWRKLDVSPSTLCNLRLTRPKGTSTIAWTYLERSGVKRVLRGSYSARIDDKGRLKIPNAFKAFVENQHGAKGVYVTSLSGHSVRIYPMPVWIAVEERLSKMPSTHPARVKFLDRVNFYGQVTEFDVQGRVLIPAQAARCRRHDRRRRRAGPGGVSRSVEPRPVPDQAPERAVHG